MNPTIQSADDSARLVVKYSGSAVNGVMDLADLVPALDSIRQTVISASLELNHGTVEPYVYLTTETRSGSYELVVLLLQIVAPNLLATAEALHSSIEIGKAVFADDGLIGLVKFIGGAKDTDVQRVKLDNGSVNYSIRGNNNTINTTINNITVAPEVDALFQTQSVRDALWGAVEPAASPGIDGVRFAVENKSSYVSKDDVKSFEPSPLELLLEDERFETHEQIVEVIKPSFDEHRLWKLAIGKKVFGAVMDDSRFQRKVLRREILFGAGDKLRVMLAVRTHSTKAPDYVVGKVLEVITPPKQMSLG